MTKNRFWSFSVSVGVALDAVVVVVGDVLDFGGLACGRVGCGRQRAAAGFPAPVPPVFHLGRAVGSLPAASNAPKAAAANSDVAKNRFILIVP